MFSLIWMLGLYVVASSAERVSWRWVPGAFAVAALDVSYRIYAKVEKAHAQGSEFAWPLHKMIGTWLVLSAFACVFFALEQWKSSARRRRRKELGLH